MALQVHTDGEGTLMVVLQYRSSKACNGTLDPSGSRRYMAADVISITIPPNELTTAAYPKATRKRFVFRKSPLHSINRARFPSLPTPVDAPPGFVTSSNAVQRTPGLSYPSLRGPCSPT
jgi:hypothetical protein